MSRKYAMTSGGIWRLLAIAMAAAVSCGCEMSMFGDPDDDSEAQPAQETVAQPVQTTAAEPQAEEPPEVVETRTGAIPPPGANPNERFTGAGCSEMPLTDGPGGFVSNPDNSRNTLKFVFPVSYRDQIARVTVFESSGAWFDEFYRQLPNEHDGRPRYYGTRPIGTYPGNLRLRVIMASDNSCHTVVIPSPQRRYD